MPLPLPAARALLAVLAFALAGAAPAQADLGACAERLAPPGVPDLGDGLLGPGSVQVHAAEEACRGSNLNLPLPPCGDGLENDGDGAVDFPGDPGCDSPLDPSELPECSDGLDNDQDGPADHPHDPGCDGPDDPSETPCGPDHPLQCGGAGAGASAPCVGSPLPPHLAEARWVGEGVLLEWAPALLQPTAYLVYRVQPEGPLGTALEPLAGVDGAATSFLDPTALASQAYVYWVTSAGAGCESAPSPPAFVGPPGVLPDTADCLDLNLDPGAMPPGVDPEYKGTGCLPL